MSFYNKTFKFAATLLLSSSIFGTAAFAVNSTQPAASTTAAAPAEVKQPTTLEKMDPNTVLATINDKKITLGDALAMRHTLPEEYTRLPLPILLDQMIKQEVLLQQAEKSNVANSADFKQRMELARKGIMISLFQQEELKKALQQQPIDDAAINTYYKEHYANKAPEKEAHVRHILVKTEPEAKKIIAEIHAGKKFDVLAKQYSLDKESSNSNGDIGWVKQNSPIIPNFLKAAFALKPNTITSTPVQTAFGWHVIQVLGYRNIPVPPLDKVKDEIKQKLFQEKRNAFLQNIFHQAKVTPNNQAIQEVSQIEAASQK